MRRSAGRFERLADILLDNAMKYAAQARIQPDPAAPGSGPASLAVENRGRLSRRKSCRICSTGSTGWMSPAPAGASAWGWPSPRVIVQTHGGSIGCTSRGHNAVYRDAAPA